MSRIGKLSILQGKYCKKQLSQKFLLILMTPGSTFMILGGLGTNLHADLGIPGTSIFELACLVASLRRRGGPWAILGHWGSTRKDILRSRFGFLLILVDLGTLFRQLFEYLGPTNVYFVMLGSRLLFVMIFGSESECLGIKKHGFGMGSIANTNFCSNRICDDRLVVMIAWSIVHDFESRLDQFSMLLLP